MSGDKARTKTEEEVPNIMVTNRMKRVLCGLLILTACSSQGETPSEGGSALPSAEITSPAPGFDRNATASDFRDGVQATLDARRDVLGRIELGPPEWVDHGVYGPILVLKISDVGRGVTPLEGATYVLLSMADGVPTIATELEGIGATHLGVTDPAEDVVYARVTDMLAFARGSVSLPELRRRLIFDL